MYEASSEVSDAEVLARMAGTALAVIGGFFLLLVLIFHMAIRQDRQKGDLSNVPRMRRKGIICAVIGVLLIAGDFFIWSLTGAYG
ncbi:hypothetical protein [Streptomyces olivochromogenes]|uniref:Integral membrane protein n=1 Tax=Streptomyces olivochromogenes TaxID=1963 RepID=A0A250VG04_STROL|nr:hypothetical protein [Streptomyces olivochromogenes]KUN44457.1 hypothetical protein AQJ27_27165 [Streptomyces olivochromogenes]GAX52992.1 hypothetical protein SO3561_04517 [Streptomyces olivochromogenes]